MNNLDATVSDNNSNVIKNMEDMNVVIVGLYTYFNVPVRILHPLAYQNRPYS